MKRALLILLFLVGCKQDPLATCRKQCEWYLDATVRYGVINLWTCTCDNKGDP